MSIEAELGRLENDPSSNYVVRRGLFTSDLYALLWDGSRLELGYQSQTGAESFMRSEIGAAFGLDSKFAMSALRRARQLTSRSRRKASSR